MNPDPGTCRQEVVAEWRWSDDATDPDFCQEQIPTANMAAGKSGNAVVHAVRGDKTAGFSAHQASQGTLQGSSGALNGKLRSTVGSLPGRADQGCPSVPPATFPNSGCTFCRMGGRIWKKSPQFELPFSMSVSPNLNTQQHTAAAPVSS